jgi:hypothetical protein
MVSKLNARPYVPTKKMTVNNAYTAFVALSINVAWFIENKPETNPRGRYAMVIYVRILMLFPCLIVVRLSSTLVTAEIYLEGQ